MIYTVTFSPALDYIMYVPQLTIGGISRSRSEALYPGGKGINVSLVLAQLGVPSRSLGFVAGFTGAALETMLRQAGCQTDFIRLAQGNTRINVKVKGEQESDINGQGPEIPVQAQWQLMEQLESLCAADTLVLAGAVPGSLSGDIYSQIVDKLSRQGVRLVVDATGALLKNTLPHAPFLIKPNNHELGELFGETLSTVEAITAGAKKAQALGARNVLVSMAGEGALLLTQSGKVIHRRPASGKVVNSVGAGDSMVAGFLAGLEKTGDYEMALNLGLAAGSATAFQEGLAQRKEIAAFLMHPEHYGLGTRAVP